MDAQAQQDLEAIRQLKARYFRLMDTQQWDAWQHCFAEDVTATFEGAPRAKKDGPREVSLSGRQSVVAGVRALLSDGVSVHQGFMPELELTGPSSARGLWSMYDYVLLPTCRFQGWGHYHEEYVKAKGEWRIQKIHLTRLHTEEDWR